MHCSCLRVFCVYLAASLSALGVLHAADEPGVNQADPPHEPFVRITQGGVMRYADGAWGVMQATAFNRSTEPVDVNGVAWFTSDPGLQFSRRFLVPQGSVRTVWMPVLTPKLPPGQKALDLQWATIRKDGSLASNRQGERLSDSPIRIPKSRVLVANLTGDSQQQSEAADLLSNFRDELGSEVIVSTLANSPFPPSREAWDIASIVVVATDEIVNDAAALNALRLWTQAGGRLWLQLDLIHSETVAALLGDALPFVETERTSTTDIEFVPGDDSLPFRTERIGLERPAAVTRVIVESPAVVHQWLNDWPAAFSFQHGSGKVFCTAVDMSAWFPPRHWRRQEEIANARDVSWLDTTEAGHQVLRNLTLNKEPTVTPEALADYVVSQVGYTTPGRSSVAGLLLGFAVALAVVSLGLRFRQKSGWMLWMIPVLALFAAGGLVAVGRASRGEPHGRVLAQIVEVESGQTTARVTEALTYYTDKTLAVDESIATGSPLIPDRAGVVSSRWRVEWSGLDEWALKNVTLPPGVRLATNTTHLEFPEPLRAVASFDQNGLTGKLTAPLELAVEDALIGGVTRVTQSVRYDSDGSFSTSDAVLPPGEYLASSLLDSEQARRQLIFRDVFRTSGRNRLALETPHLLFWSRPLLPGSGMTAVRNDVGASLILVPLELQRPATSTEMLIPGPFLPYESVPMTKAGGVPSYFNSRTCEWTQARNGSRILLRFQVPPTLLPVVPTSGTLTIKLSAGARQVTVQSGRPGDLTTADPLDSSVGTFDIPLTLDGLQTLDDRGGLHILLEVSDVETDEPAAAETSDGLTEIKDEYWKVEWMSLALQARVAEQETETAPQAVTNP